MPEPTVSEGFAPVEVATLDSHYDSQEALEGDQNLDVTALARSIAGRAPEPVVAKPDAAPVVDVDDAEPIAAQPDAREDGAKWNGKAGRWQKADGSFAEGAAPDGITPDEPVETKEPVVPRKTSYEAYDGEESVDVPESLTVKFTAANGKQYAKNLDGLVELAKHGTYNHELQQEAKQAREELTQVPQLRQRITELEQAPERTAAYVERLFSDMNFLASEIEAYEQSNTPDARAERAERALQDEREKFSRAATMREAEAYAATNVHAPFADLLTQYPSVSVQDASQELAALVAPYKVNGVVPPASLPTVARLVSSHLAPWMAQQHEHRSTASATANAKSKAEQDAQAKAHAAAQKKTLALKRQVARAIAPSGASGSTGTTGQRKPAKNYRDAADSALDKALKSVGAA